MTVNNKLDKTEERVKENELSLNIRKTKCTFVHKNSIKGDIPLKLPELKIGNREINRKNSMKILGLLLDKLYLLS